MRNYIKLIRPINIAIIIAVVCLMQCCIINPIMARYNVSFDNFWLIFALELIATVTIAASGYVINDYFDTKIDEINRPSKVIVGHGVTRAQAATYFQTLLIIGNIAGIALAILLKNITLVFIYAGVSGLLWFYSSSYKRQLLLGNFMIALCTFLCVFLVGYVANKALFLKYQENITLLPEFENDLTTLFLGGAIPCIYMWTIGFALFAFQLTLMREMVKDIEDIEGDREMECRTMPIVWGETTSKIIITVISAITIALVGFFTAVICGWTGVSPIFLIPFENDNTTLSFSVILAVFLLFFIGQLWMARCKSGFASASMTLKITMVLGLCYSIVFKMLI